MVIVDSSVWVDYLRGVSTPQTDWVHREIDVQRLGILDLILCEVLQGIVEDRRFAEVHRSLLALEVFTTGGIELSVAAAQNYRALRARGKTVRKTVDCLIATFCILNDHVLLHADSDFDHFERELGLKVLHPEYS
jgi:predicted nucleic acid-binding protein